MSATFHLNHLIAIGRCFLWHFSNNNSFHMIHQLLEDIFSYYIFIWVCCLKLLKDGLVMFHSLTKGSFFFLWWTSIDSQWLGSKRSFMWLAQISCDMHVAHICILSGANQSPYVHYTSCHVWLAKLYIVPAQNVAEYLLMRMRTLKCKY